VIINKLLLDVQLLVPISHIWIVYWPSGAVEKPTTGMPNESEFPKTCPTFQLYEFWFTEIFEAIVYGILNTCVQT
jgi:hypothetical protein